MNISPFVRNLGILAVIAAVIMVLNLETSLITAAPLTWWRLSTADHPTERVHSPSQRAAHNLPAAR